MATLVDPGGRTGAKRREHHAPVEVERYYGLARALAHRFAGRGESTDDLEQVALLALLKASQRYRPAHPAHFASYATACILGELKRHFRDRAWMMRVPRSVQERFLAVKSARGELEQALGCSPTVAQIARYLGIGDEEVLDAIEAGESYSLRSLDVPCREGDEPGLEVGVVDENFDRRLEHRQLRESLNTLPVEQRKLIRRIYFEGQTQRAVATELGVSQMQVSRMVARVMDKLRRSMEAA